MGAQGSKLPAERLAETLLNRRRARAGGRAAAPAPAGRGGAAGFLWNTEVPF